MWVDYFYLLLQPQNLSFQYFGGLKILAINSLDFPTFKMHQIVSHHLEVITNLL